MTSAFCHPERRLLARRILRFLVLAILFRYRETKQARYSWFLCSLRASASFCHGEEVDADQQHLRLNRMAIARMRKGEIVNHRDGNEHPEKQHGCARAPAQGHRQPKKSQDRGKRKEQVAAELHKNIVGGARRAEPEKEKAFEADSCKAAGVLLHPFDGFALALGDIGNLAEAPVFLQLSQVLAGMQPVHPLAVSARSISQAKFRAGIAADEYKLAENLVVARQPGSNAGKKQQSRQNCIVQSHSAGAVLAVEHPYSTKWQEGQQRRIAQGNQRTQEAEPQPAREPIVALQ